MPRALGGRAFGERAVFVEVAEGDPALDAFGEALSRAVRRSGARLVGAPVGPTAVITVHRLYRTRGGEEAVTLSVGSGPRARRIVLHHPPGRRDEAARALLETLAAHGC